MCDPVLVRPTRRRFAADDDEKLKNLVGDNPKPDWQIIARNMSPFTSRQCREHWRDFISPSNNDGPWTQDEDERLLGYLKTGNTHWTALQKFFPGRSAIRIKNRMHQLERREHRHMKLKVPDDSEPRPNPVINLLQMEENEEFDEVSVFSDSGSSMDDW
jgi:hypothetical protein